MPGSGSSDVSSSETIAIGVVVGQELAPEIINALQRHFRRPMKFFSVDTSSIDRYQQSVVNARPRFVSHIYVSDKMPDWVILFAREMPHIKVDEAGKVLRYLPFPKTAVPF